MSKLGSIDVYSVSKASTERFSTSTSSWVPLSEVVSGSDRDRQPTALARRLQTSLRRTNTLSCSLLLSQGSSHVYAVFGGIATPSYSRKKRKDMPRGKVAVKEKPFKDYVNDVISRQKVDFRRCNCYLQYKIRRVCNFARGLPSQIVYIWKDEVKRVRFIPNICR